MEKRERDEYLERLWDMKEKGLDTVADLRSNLDVDYNSNTLASLILEGWITLSKDEKKVYLTKKGEDRARQLIRAHRLAERLIFDVLGEEDSRLESGACEFEHIVAPELVDSICTLLGHPTECPHGRPIPEGDCCKQKARILRSSVAPLTELRVGESARVAYIRCERDDQLHYLDSLCIRPGATLKLHQRYPAYVIECERGNIALEGKVANNIYVRLKGDQASMGPGRKQGISSNRVKRRRWRLGKG